MSSILQVPHPAAHTQAPVSRSRTVPPFGSARKVAATAFLACGAVLGLFGSSGPEKAMRVTISGTVNALDVEQRELTLKGKPGNLTEMTVDTNVKHLDQLKVGDEIRVDYYMSYATDVRPPTEEEKAAHKMELPDRAEAPEGTSPLGGGLRRYKIVTTVEGLDPSTHSVTIKGWPKGYYLTTVVDDPARYAKLKMGDTIVITYTEGLLLSFEKIAP
jgi:hypothetical protein